MLLRRLIDEKGVYKTRSGLKVRIEEVDDGRQTNPMTFNCQGWIIRDGNKGKEKEWKSFHWSGRVNAFAEDSLDIVEKINFY